MAGNQGPTSLTLVEPSRPAPVAGLTGRRRIPRTTDPGQEVFEGRTAVVVVLAGQVQVVVTQLVEDHPLQVGVHQRVDVNVVVSQVVTAPRRLQPGIEHDPV